MTYTARIERNGQPARYIKLGRCPDVSHACLVAARRCPAGWQVTDVHGA